jgi:hypothetical protein
MAGLLETTLERINWINYYHSRVLELFLIKSHTS